MWALIYRLTKEYEKLLKDLPTGVNVYLPCESDVYTWEATVKGPVESLYKGNRFSGPAEALNITISRRNIYS